MRASDIMTKKVVTVSDSSSVEEAAKLLLEQRISALPVLDMASKLVGIVSEGDLMRRAETGTQHRRSWWLELLAGAESLASEYIKENSRRIADVMTKEVITAGPETELGEIAKLLEKHAIKRVPIMDDGKLVGIVSRSNLLQGLATLGKELKTAGKGDDGAIREKILERLEHQPWRPFMLNVTVHNGEVDLWGVADSTAQKQAARVAVEGVPGVTVVNDNVVVKPVSYAT